MKSQRPVISWMPRMGSCLVAGLLLVAGLVPGGILGAGEGVDEGAPLRPVTRVPYPPGTGYVPPRVDLSHLTGQALPSGAAPADLPAAYDWRGYGVVTPVKNQGTCGSCYAFGSLGSLESKLAIDGAGTWDLSENHAKECNWRERNGYEDPPGNPWGSCDGGNSWMIANLYAQTGSVLESCDPYQASDVACSMGCPYQQSLLDFRVISGDSVPSTGVLKQYLYDNGPIITSMYIDSGQGFDNSYTGAYTFNYGAPAGDTNHCVLLVGWSNNLPPVPGGSTPADGWIVKNSWGTGWGDSGYFYMTYGAANIGYNSTFFHEWQTYDPNGDIWYHDEDGYNYSFGQSGGTNTTAWILAKHIPPSNTNVTRIEFWASDATTDVDVYLYDSFDGNAPSNLLASKLNSSFGETGYHSVPLDAPVAVSNGDAVYAVVKVTNVGYGYPITVDANGPLQTGVTYRSYTGNPGTWGDTSGFGNATVRVRTSTSVAPGPTATSITPNSGENTGTVHITNLAGSNFQPGATVKLTRSGQPDIPGSNVVVNPSQITCDFSLTGAAAGPWNAVVTNPDMQTATLTNGFTVTAPSAEDYYVYLPLVWRSEPPPSGWTVVKSEDFEGPFPNDWDVEDTAVTNGEHYWGKRTCRPYAGSYSGWAVGGGDGAGLSCGANYPTYVLAWMIYGPFSLADATDAELTFQLWLNSELDYDKVGRAASIDGDLFYGTSTSGNTGGWVDRTLDLTAVPTLGDLTGQSNVWVALIFESDETIVYPEGGYVDDILLQKYVGTRSARQEEGVPAAPATIHEEVLQIRLNP